MKKLSQQPSPFVDLRIIDPHQFGIMTEPHRRELQAHCYRMLGLIHDAEDVVQETFLRAWRRRETYEGRATFRAWLYKIATNLCLDTLAQRPRRMIPVTRQAASTMDEPIPPSVMEPIWLEPIPDDWLATNDVNPEADFATRENITIAFIAALHLLPPRQRAVLILRDVLEWQANEVAQLLDLSVPAVKSALHRARTTLAKHPLPHSSAALDEATQSQLEDYVRAWESADVNALMTLLKSDATFSMPPIPSWYQGRETIGQLVSKTIFSGDASGRWRLVAVNANLQRAYGLYQLNSGVYRGYGVQLLTFHGGEIADITTFRDPSLLPYFKLPMTLE